MSVRAPVAQPTAAGLPAVMVIWSILASPVARVDSSRMVFIPADKVTVVETVDQVVQSAVAGNVMLDTTVPPFIRSFPGLSAPDPLAYRQLMIADPLTVFALQLTPHLLHYLHLQNLYP